jgi:hypothetical protein
MILPANSYICPICGLVLPALAAYHSHYEREHRRKRTLSIDNKLQP